MRRFYLLCILVLFAMLHSSVPYCQDFSNKGKDFWVGYGYHIQMGAANPPGGSQDMFLYFVTDSASDVTVSCPGTGWSVNYSIPANTVFTTGAIPKSSPDHRLTTEGLSSKGIHVVSTKPIVAYAHIFNSAISGATILYPTNTLGKEYYSVNYKQSSNNANSNCWFYVIAADTGTTTVEITPSANTTGGWVAGNTYTVTLTQGQTYNVMGQLLVNTGNGPYTGVDLTGSKIKSIAAGNSGCKKIAVFSGSGKIHINCSGTPNTSADNYMVQAMPKASWGKTYLTVPTATYGNANSANPSNNIYRICVDDPTAVVNLNGAPIPYPLQNNFYYELPPTNIPQYITADKPIMVAQYLPSQGASNCSAGNGDGDPEVIYLSSVEQNISKVRWNACQRYCINANKHYINVVIPNTGTAITSFKLDGVTVPASSFTVHPFNSAYSYAILNVSGISVGNCNTYTGPYGTSHLVESDSGFNAIAYGYGAPETYGYNAGTNIRDIYQYVTIQNQYATVNFPATCRNAPFYFTMTFPYQPTSIEWNFGTLFTPPNNTFSMPNPALYFIGTIVVNGRTLYQYKIPNPYTVTVPAGTYPIQVTAINPTPDGCGNTQEINYDLQVFDPPIADFTFNVVCFNQPTPFIDNSNTGGRPVISRYWDFGDAATSTANNPTHLYAAPGSYNVKYSLITDVGCLSDTVQHIVAVNPLPTASISGTTTGCLNATAPDITFTGANATAPYTFTYTINGGPNLTVTSVGNTATVSVPTTTAGTYTYTLISVQDANATTCSQLQSGTAIVTVNPLPTATIAGTIEVCLNAASPNITFTGGGTITPYTFTYTINGGPNQTVTSVGNIATVAVPTTTAGTFTYTLISVQDASTTTCSQLQSGTAIVTVNPLPTASITGTIEVCQNAASPVITFTGGNATAPYTFTYTINGGTNLTVTSVGNTATVSVPTSTVGTFTYTLISVQDASATTCSQLQSGNATVIVHPLPTSNFSFTIPSCETRTISFTDLSVPNVGALTTWTWDFGDGSLPVTINSPASPNISHTFATAGTYNVLLVVTNDKGCVSVTPAQAVTIHSRPLAGYIIPEVCLSDTYAQFIDTSKVTAPDIITTWQWNFGDPGSGPLNTSTLQNPQHSYTATGSYNVQLIVTSNNGCRDTLVQPLFINGSFPVAAFTVPTPTTLCANDSVSIVEASTVFPGTITKVEIYWDNVGQPVVFDIDNFPVPGKIYKHLYPNFQAPLTRTFTIRYRAYSGGVCVDDTLKNITVNAAPLVQFNNMPNVCLDAAPFQITQASEIGGVPGTAVFSGPGVTPGGIFNPASVGPGTYTILYTFTSTTGGCVDTMSNTITVWLPPIADFSSSTPACETKAITFTDNSNTPVGALTTWTWDFGDGTPVLVRNNNLPFTHTFANWGTYNVTLFVTTSNGCKSVVKTISVTINPQPKPNFSTPASSCLPDATVAFTNLTTIADGSLASCTYLWNFGDPGSGANNISTLTNPSHIYTSTGPFNVQLLVTSGNGCVDSITTVLNTVHPQPLASFITDKIDVCIGSSITFTNTSDPMDGVITQYNWTMGDGNVMSTPTFAYTYSALGTYNVSLFIFNSHGCRSTTYSQTVYVNPYPVTNAGPDKFMLEGGQVMLTPVLVTNMTVSYLWSPPQYLNNPAIPNTIASPPDDKYYTLTITSDKGCSTSDVVFIKVLKMPAIPNIFSPNGDGVHDKWVIDYLDSYPGCTVDIFNRYGQHIWHSEGYANPWDGTINGQPVPIGTYYYIVDPKNGRKIMSGYVDVIR